MHAQQSGETQHEPVIPIDTMNYANGATTHALQLQKEAEELVRAAELEGAKKMAPKGLFKSLSPDYESYVPDPISTIPRPGTHLGKPNPGNLGETVLRPRNLSREASLLTTARAALQYKVPKPGDGSGFTFEKARTDAGGRSQLILKKKADNEAKKVEEVKKIKSKIEEQKGKPGNVIAMPVKSQVEIKPAPPVKNTVTVATEPKKEEPEKKKPFVLPTETLTAEEKVQNAAALQCLQAHTDKANAEQAAQECFKAPEPAKPADAPKA